MAEIPMSKEQRLAVFKVVRDIAKVLTKDR
jgi:hypothetical protein